jgi:hypothetical protein
VDTESSSFCFSLLFITHKIFTFPRRVDAILLVGGYNEDLRRMQQRATEGGV